MCPYDFARTIQISTLIKIMTCSEMVDILGDNITFFQIFDYAVKKYTAVIEIKEKKNTFEMIT